MPVDLVPDVAVLLEEASLGIKEAVRLDVIDDVVIFDLEVILLGVHGEWRGRLGTP